VEEADEKQMKEENNQQVIEVVSGLMWIVLGMMLITTLTIGLTSAIYVGETYNYTFEGNIVNCSSQESNLNITWNNTIVYVLIEPDFSKSNFTIECYLQGEEVIVVHSSGRSHHSSKKVILNTTNTTNQQENISSETNTNFSTPADTTLPPILNLSNDSNFNPSSEELNKQIKDFFKSYGIGILIIFLIIFLGWVIYYVYEEYFSEEEIRNYIPQEEIKENKIDFSNENI